MTATFLLQDIHRIACDLDLSPHERLILILRRFVLEEEGSIVGGQVVTLDDTSEDLTVSQALAELAAIRELYGGDVPLDGVREFVPVVWTPEERAREGGALRNCVMLAG